MSAKNRIRVTPQQLTATVPAGWLDFTTTADLERHLGMIGQERAMSAVEVGLKVRTRGYNIFAVGEPGSGKTSTLERILRRRAADEPLPGDLCYVYNFAQPDRPRPLVLPAGQGRALAKDMERVFVELGRLIPRVLSEGAFGHIRAGIIAETRRKMDDVTRRTSEVAARLDLRLEETENQLRVVPLVAGEPVDESQIPALPARARRQLEKRMLEFHKHVDAFTYARRQIERAHDARLLAAETRAVGPLVEELFHEISWRYRKQGEDLATYLEQAKEFVLANHRLFAPDEEKEPKGNGNGEAIECELPEPPSQADPRLLLHVNVVVDRSAESGAPVVVERVPAAGNLCGVFEYRETPGGLTTDHSMIRAGALHQANGGYLLIQAIDLLTQENAWLGLKRALRHKEIRIEEGMGPAESRPRLAGALKPGAVPLNVKVILVGGYDVYFTLKTEDEEFQRLFKILADFEPSMPRTKENVVKLAKFCGQVCREEGYLPLHRSGMARIVEFASRRAENKERLITRWAEVLDLLAEANMFARAASARTIRAADIERALAEADRRNGSLVDAVVREIDSGTIIIRTEGAAVGQLNGIALYDVAGTTFGVPVRITARAYAGRRGVVNIDREVNLSGAVHDKGALILIGYLGGRFAQGQPLGFSASVTFEQSYDEIDGDSASSSELYALLSALADVPIRQGIAVTGSVNQLGEVQPIGGVNEKIEGVFRVAAGRGLTGGEGVMIPAANVRNLMLRRDVIDAVRAGRFHVYAVSTVDEGIEVLTGIEAGRLRRDGSWTPGSINDRVQRRLGKLLEIVREEPGASIPRGL
jgi:lon-related putative ATP-dependent protease